MSRINLLTWLYFGLITSLAALNYPFIAFSFINGQLPLPLPSTNSTSSQPSVLPIFPPRLPQPSPLNSESQYQSQNQTLAQSLQDQDQAPLLNSSSFSTRNLDLSNFLRDFSSRVRSCSQLAILNVDASGSQSGSPARNAIDNSFETRWSNAGLGSSITLDFGAERSLCNMDIAWYRGNERIIDFTISLSNDSKSWKDVVTATSSGNRSEPESYDLPDIVARYLRVTGTASSASDWVSISEVKVFGRLVPNPSAPVSQSRASSPTQPIPCTPSAISSAKASGSQASYPPENTIDNNITTRWANHGLKSSITLDLGQETELCSINVAWYKGNERTNDFIILASNDSRSFTDVQSRSTTGDTLDFEGYNLPDVVARYVRMTVTGSSENDWISISEIKIFGVRDEI